MIIFYIIDTETTGLSSSYHEMTEISIIRYTDKIQLTRNIKCHYPERANADALRITNKTLSDLSFGSLNSSVVDECENFFNQDNQTAAHRCIVGHNISFDKKFLHQLWEKSKKVFPANLWLCTMALTKSYAKVQGLTEKHLPKLKYNLQASCDLLGFKKISQAHSAKADSRNTFLLFKNLIENNNLDYLPFIQTEIHKGKILNQDEEPDMSLLDDIE